MQAFKFLKKEVNHGANGTKDYVIKKNVIYPIDISFLFCSDNDKWSRKYLTAGMYEFNYLTRYSEDKDLLKSKVEAFFNTYEETLTTLKNNKQEILQLVSDFYGGSSQETKDKLQYIQEHIRKSQYEW